MKNFCKAFLTLCAVLAVLALTGCPGVFNPPESGNAGVLTVTINGAGGARQILPTEDPVFVDYELTFVDFDTDEPISATIEPVWGEGDEANVAIITDLPVGKYKVTAKGLVSTSDGTAVAAVGEGEVEIETLLDEKLLDIKISALIEGTDLEDGTFSYDVTIPDWVTSGTLTIELADSTGTPTVKNLLNDPADIISLAPGYYLLTVELANADERSADYVDIVYIYQNIETPWEFEFEDGDFAYPLPGAAINGSPVSVSGTVANSEGDGAEDADVEVTITLSHATVASALSGDVSSWFSVKVDGLTYTAAADAGDDEIIITIEGEPEEISTATDVTITIPIGAIKDVTGTANAAALTVTGHVAYDIDEAPVPLPVVNSSTGAVSFTDIRQITANQATANLITDGYTFTTSNSYGNGWVKFKLDFGTGNTIYDYVSVQFTIHGTGSAAQYKDVHLKAAAALPASGDVQSIGQVSEKKQYTANSQNFTLLLDTDKTESLTQQVLEVMIYCHTDTNATYEITDIVFNKATRYDVSFDWGKFESTPYAGSASVPAPIKVTLGTTVGTLPEDPEDWTGYYFEGWYLDSTKVYSTTVVTADFEDATLYAHWTNTAIAPLTPITINDFTAVNLAAIGGILVSSSESNYVFKGNYPGSVKFKVSLPEGRTLADYSTINFTCAANTTFKTFIVLAGESLSVGDINDNPIQNSPKNVTPDNGTNHLGGDSTTNAAGMSLSFDIGGPHAATVTGDIEIAIVVRDSGAEYTISNFSIQP